MAKNKLKTHKGTAKRFWKTKTGKIMRRTATQDHFNSRETSNHKRGKRRDSMVAKTDSGNVSKLLPYA